MINITRHENIKKLELQRLFSGKSYEELSVVEPSSPIYKAYARIAIHAGFKTRIHHIGTPELTINSRLAKVTNPRAKSRVAARYYIEFDGTVDDVATLIRYDLQYQKLLQFEKGFMFLEFEVDGELNDESTLEKLKKEAGEQLNLLFDRYSAFLKLVEDHNQNRERFIQNILFVELEKKSVMKQMENRLNPFL